MLPLRDLNPTRRVPIITYALIGINVLVFLWELSFSEAQLQQVFIDLAVVPANLARSGFTPDNILDIIRSMFFHGGWAHLLGNMLYLWLFGDNIEDRLGILMYLVVYFVSGFAAALAQYLIDPTSQIPLIGASGAIAGVLGGYLVLFPGVKVQGIIPLGWFSSLVEWPAVIVLGLWFVMQLFNGVASFGPDTADAGVAFFAHIGGFIVGAMLTYLVTMFVPQPPAEARNQNLYDRAQR